MRYWLSVLCVCFLVTLLGAYLIFVVCQYLPNEKTETHWDIGNARLGCVGEQTLERLPEMLDRLWLESAVLIRRNPVPARPHFCFSWTVLLLVDKDFHPLARLYGTVNREHTEVLVAMLPHEEDAMMRCVCQHEMLHALGVKSDEEIERLVPCLGKSARD